MQCKSCQYPLWNLRERKCPECGAEFHIRDYTFTVNSVQFRCPHCEQAYYGTEKDTGYLIPAEFTCSKCSNFIRMDEMVLLPTEGVQEIQTKPPQNPWLEPYRVSFIPWARTAFLSCFAPLRLMGMTSPETPARRAWSFYFQTIAMVALLGIGGMVLFGVIMAFVMNGLGFGSLAAVITGTGGGMLIGFLVLAAITFVWLMVIHGVLMATGPTAGILRTTHAVCFGAGPLITGCIPCLAIYSFWPGILWWVINTTIMLAHVHRAAAWRAMLATMALPLFAIFALTCLLYVRDLI